MKNILCYGDSNTYGLTPTGNPRRWDDNTRWPRLLQKALGNDYYIIEEGLSGRTTCFDDPIEMDRNGVRFLHMVLDTHCPLDLIIIMLGTNDTKIHFDLTPEEITAGIEKCIKEIEHFHNSISLKTPEILLVSPIEIGKECEFKKEWRTSFNFSSHEKSKALAPLYRELSEKLNIHFLDAALYAKCGSDDVHLEEDGHLAIYKAIESKILEIFL